MTMKKSFILNSFIFITILMIVFSFSCCNKHDPVSTIDSTEKEIVLERVWELEVEKYSDDPFVYGDYAVLIEGKKYVDENKYFYLSKIDLLDGTKIWETEKYYCFPGSENKIVNGRPVKCGSYIFVIVPAGDDDFADLLIFNESDGSFFQKISDLDIKGSATLIPYKEKYLFWQSWDWENDISNPATDCSVIHKFNIEKMQEEKFVSKIHGNILSDLYIDESSGGGVLYYETMGGYDFDYGGGYPYPKINPEVGAYDCETGNLIWTHKIENSVWPGMQESLLINDNNLYVMDYGLVCLDKRNGKVKYENLMETIDFTNAYNGDVFRGESPYMFFYDNKIFCTNGSSWSGEAWRDKYYKNIQCLNANNGKLIWGDLPYDSCSLGGRPAVINNRLFVATYYQGVRVYNPKNGTLLGVDPTILNGGEGKNPVYKDLFLTITTNDSEWSKCSLVALKWPE